MFDLQVLLKLTRLFKPGLELNASRFLRVTEALYSQRKLRIPTEIRFTVFELILLVITDSLELEAIGNRPAAERFLSSMSRL